jgi:hypothetical protein
MDGFVWLFMFVDSAVDDRRAFGDSGLEKAGPGGIGRAQRAGMDGFVW